MNALYDADANPAKLRDKTIAVIGYGSQGRAHSRNLHDSGFDVTVGLRDGSPSHDKVHKDGLKSTSVEQAVAGADVVMILAPDEEQPALFLRSVIEHLKPGAYLAFAHGFGIHFGTVVPPKSVNVFMAAPKGPGDLVRTQYEVGRGVPCLIAIHQDPSGDICIGYADDRLSENNRAEPSLFTSLHTPRPLIPFNLLVRLELIGKIRVEFFWGERCAKKYPC